MMYIQWKIKAKLFKIIDYFSLYRFLYFLQKRVTGRSKPIYCNLDANWIIHRNNVLPDKNTKLIEFGAGKNLAQNLYLSKFGCHQTLVDINHMLDISQLNDVAKQLQSICQIDFPSVKDLNDLLIKYKIKYIAPLDICNSPFENGFYDACISTNTLEHIPVASLLLILKELKRIIKRGGVFSAIIDYSDHYSHTDKSIGPLNFLKYSSIEFGRYNFAIHYQNRLRHYHYEKIFKDEGFIFVKNEVLDTAIMPSNIADEFDVNEPTLNATKGLFVLKVP